MSDIEILDVMLGYFQEIDQVRDESASEVDFDVESRRRQGGSNKVEGDFRTLLITNASKNSELTAWTSRAINFETSSQMSRKLEETKSDLNSHIVDLINSALAEKVIPSIKSAIEGQNSAKTTNLDLRLDGPLPSNFAQVRTQRDVRSNGLNHEKSRQVAQDAQKDCPRLVATGSNRIHHRRENSVDFNQSDDEEGYDRIMVLIHIHTDKLGSKCKVEKTMGMNKNYSKTMGKVEAVFQRNTLVHALKTTKSFVFCSTYVVCWLVFNVSDVVSQRDHFAGKDSSFEGRFKCYIEAI